MATAAPQVQNLPLLYNDLVPLNVEQHGNFKLSPNENAPYLVGVHAVPLTSSPSARATCQSCSRAARTRCRSR